MASHHNSGVEGLLDDKALRSYSNAGEGNEPYRM
jgi:hypothetical protein